jgi:proline-specific peptidase
MLLGFRRAFTSVSNLLSRSHSTRAKMTSPAFTEGKIDFKHEGETFQTYYKLFGDLKTATAPPLVGLHGGPGLTHNYLAPLADLATKFGIPVIIYDQLGNGLSTHLKEKPPTFWTVDLFIDELINLTNHFGIQDAYSLLGHSWGGILGSEFEVRRQPKGLKHLILSDSLAASSLWNKSNMELMQTFPASVQEGLGAGMKEPAKFWAALQEFHAVYGCTVKPVPEEFVYTMQQVFGPDGDPTVAGAPYVVSSM